MVATAPVAWMALQEPAETLADEISRRLADEIVTGALPPGAKLDEHAVAQRYGASRTPVREALRRLGGAGLIELRPRRGATVARIEVEQLTDMFDAMGELEGLCARLAAQRMTMMERRRLEMLGERAKAALKAETPPDYARLNDEFHDLVYQGAHNATIAALTMGLRQRLAPFRVLQFVRGHTEDYFVEHEEIAAAIAAADGERAYRAMRSHMASASVLVIERFAGEAGPGPAAQHVRAT